MLLDVDPITICKKKLKKENVKKKVFPTRLNFIFSFHYFSLSNKNKKFPKAELYFFSVYFFIEQKKKKLVLENSKLKQ